MNDIKCKCGGYPSKDCPLHPLAKNCAGKMIKCERCKENYCDGCFQNCPDTHLTI